METARTAVLTLNLPAVGGTDIGHKAALCPISAPSTCGRNYGHYDTQLEAARARDAAARDGGAIAVNFPNPGSGEVGRLARLRPMNKFVHSASNGSSLGLYLKHRGTQKQKCNFARSLTY